MKAKEWVITDLIAGRTSTHDAYDVRGVLQGMFDESDPETVECVNAVTDYVERGVPLDPGVTEYLQITIERG